MLTERETAAINFEELWETLLDGLPLHIQASTQTLRLLVFIQKQGMATSVAEEA